MLIHQKKSARTEPMESKEISRDTNEVNENNYVLIETDHFTGNSTKLTPTETVQIISDNFSRIK
jgi:hypothetical protein